LITVGLFIKSVNRAKKPLKRVGVIKSEELVSIGSNGRRVGVIKFDNNRPLYKEYREGQTKNSITIGLFIQSVNRAKRLLKKVGVIKTGLFDAIATPYQEPYCYTTRDDCHHLLCHDVFPTSLL